MKTEYGVQFFKQFELCLNALDNRAARNHVNRYPVQIGVANRKTGYRKLPMRLDAGYPAFFIYL